MVEKGTLAHLLCEGYEYVPVRNRFKSVVMDKTRKRQELFPNIYGLEREKRRITEFLMAGKPVLLTGVYGVAKTDIAKQVVDLLSEFNRNNEVFYVDNCPIQEDPLNIAHALGLTKQGNHPCPICEENYHLNNGGVKPEEVRVKRFDSLSEGRGFARVQSGFDTHPEELIGTYNLVKLAEIGDPFDPQVFQPGKIGQSSGGVLFVDEVGKLSEAGQYALIQAAEEGIVTPTKSRRTFPVDMLLIATTNPEDEDNINGAVYDRLRSIKIDVVGRDDEIKIAQKELRKLSNPLYMPELFMNWGVDSIRAMREKLEDVQLGPRTTIDMVAMSNSSANFDNRDVATYCDFKEGVYSAVQARTRFEDMEKIASRIRKQVPEIRDYLRSNLSTDMCEVTEELREAYGDRVTHQNVKEALTFRTKQKFNYTKALAQELERTEGLKDGMLPKVIAVYNAAFTRGCPSDSE